MNITPMTDLAEMLRSLDVSVRDDSYVFASVTPEVAMSVAETAATVVESEGTTVVIASQHAERYGFESTPQFAWLTLTIHSSLEAVGLTAAFSRVMADAGISCNVLAGFHHDHLLVPIGDKERAIETLRALRHRS